MNSSLETLDIDHLAKQFQSSELFRVIVGPEKTEYHLHKQTLIDRCPYFAGLHSFGGIETTGNAVSLTDLPNRAFKVFITFIYGNVYQIPTDLKVDEAFILHAEVYIMADMMCMTDLRAVAFDSVKKIIKRGAYVLSTLVLVVEHIYNNTPDREADRGKAVTESGSTHAMRKLLVKVCCYYLKDLMKCRNMDKLVKRHGELAVDMLSRLNSLPSIDYNED
ncbi:hypothetical protein K440DRAFT_660721 [Wilcoxina mikolae CBS 423.85]|nr:hypothetical protein K440DRAFT_660721 [Wilcoxina mikolae CBS 423.85]